MTNLRIALLAGLALLAPTACLADSTDPVDDVTMPEGKADADQARLDPTVAAEDLDVCGQLPQDDSACAHACEPDVLLTFIPKHSCVTFKCTLTDGGEMFTGGCNP